MASQSIIPSLFYDDMEAALDWLPRAFGCELVSVHRGEDGRAEHAELSISGGVIMLSPTPGHGGWKAASPRTLGAVNQGLYVYVADVDAHFRRAREAGAEIVAEPKDQFYGDRNYSARDPEGHYWGFGTRLS